ncbi:MAG: trehalose-6-phosphate synthase [Candidatus Melainabacteria bacterium]|nr:trehalose-6-phosphate synthase [Candidatus Melainabacteria bacterium]
MDLVSYRGPGAAGGVSSGLSRIWCSQSQVSSSWWYLNQGVLERSVNTGSLAAPVSTVEGAVSESLRDGHYRFCNEFLWPVMHDLPQYASFSKEEFSLYLKFNRKFAEQLDRCSEGRAEYFVQDYQLALLPDWLSRCGHRSVIFWHIPWPKAIAPEYLEPLKEIARGMLSASSIGFHVAEYAFNFMEFVRANLSDYKVDSKALLISAKGGRVASTGRFIRQGHRRLNNLSRKFRSGSDAVIWQTGVESSNCSINAFEVATALLIQPLGIDFEYWSELRQTCLSEPLPLQLSTLSKRPFVLSVDRVDYTKSVLDRLLIVDEFFEAYPQWLGRITFAQVCGRSRAGLEAFDQYWFLCRSLADRVNARWRSGDWQPVEWLEQPLSSVQLAVLYRQARTMLVNPVRDGLNLTAKEFIACQSQEPGTLLLSPGAGAWQELGDYALAVYPHEHAATIRAINRSLLMPLGERQLRTSRLKKVIADNQVSTWWSRFESILSPKSRDWPAAVHGGGLVLNQA